jgi:ribonuclease P protein component
VLRSRWRARKQFFSVHCAPNDCQYPRLGLIVARRLAGNSVKRNAVKRLVREVFRMRQGDIAGWDWVVRLTSLPGPNQWDQARRELQAMFTVRS